MRDKLQPENNVNVLFSPQEKDFFLSKIFIDKQPESAFLYKGNGADFFDKIVQSGKYMGNTDEMSLLKKEKYNILNFVGENITDIGCGNGNKAIILLEGQNNKKYTACDYSGSMIEIAENNIRETNPNITFGNHQVMRPGNSLFTSNLKNNTYLRLGGEMGCHTKNDIKDNLMNMNNEGVLSGNKILFSYYKAPKTEEEMTYTKDMYDNKESQDFVFNGLTNLGIDTSGLKYFVDYNTKTNTVEVGVEFLRDYEMPLSNGKKILKKKGEKSVIHRSKRFTDEEITKILKESGLKAKKTFSKNSTVLVVADRAPKYGKKVKRIVSLSGTLILATLVGGVGTYKYMKDKEEQHKKSLYDKSTGYKLKNEEISFYGLNEVYEKGKDIEKKKEHLENVVTSLWGVFKEVYGEGKNPDAVKAIIANSLMKENEYGNSRLQSLFQSPIDWSLMRQNDMLLNDIVPENEIALSKLGYNTLPYNEFSKYEEIFDNTLELNQNLSVNAKGSSGMGQETSANKYLKTFSSLEGVSYEYVGYFYDYHDYSDYNFIKVYDKNNNEILLASPNSPYYGDDRKYTYTLSHAKEGILKMKAIRAKYKK